MWRPTELQQLSKRMHSSTLGEEVIKSDEEDQTTTEAVESLEEVSEIRQWYRLLLKGPKPAARSKHAAMALGCKMFVMGGNSGQSKLDDVQMLHIEKMVWVTVGCSTPPGTPGCKNQLLPHGPPSVGHSVAVWDKCLLVVGGQIDPPSPRVTVYAFNLELHTWSPIIPRGETPVARTGQSTVQCGSMLVMFGGEDDKSRMLNDLHILDLKQQHWLPLKNTMGTRPPARRDHNTTCYGRRYLYVFGGRSRTTYFNDLYRLDFQSMVWTREKTKGIIPLPRAGHAAVVAGTKWYIIGGKYGNTGASTAAKTPDTVSLDLDTLEWTMVSKVKPGSPPANDALSSVEVQSKGRSFLVAFGGYCPKCPCNEVYVMLLGSTEPKQGVDPTLETTSTFKSTSSSMYADDGSSPPCKLLRTLADRLAADRTKEKEENEKDISSHSGELDTESQKKDATEELDMEGTNVIEVKEDTQDGGELKLECKLLQTASMNPKEVEELNDIEKQLATTLGLVDSNKDMEGTLPERLGRDTMLAAAVQRLKQFEATSTSLSRSKDDMEKLLMETRARLMEMEGHVRSAIKLHDVTQAQLQYALRLRNKAERRAEYYAKQVQDMGAVSEVQSLQMAAVHQRFLDSEDQRQNLQGQLRAVLQQLQNVSDSSKQESNNC